MCPGPASRANTIRRRELAVRPRRGSDASEMMNSRLSISSSSTSSASLAASVMPRESVSGRWIEDAAVKSCTKCDRGFTVVHRRHHCRICGHIFCNACSRTRMVLATKPSSTPKRQRVCDNCAAHAHSNALLYDQDSEQPRNGSLSSTSSSSTEVLVGSETDVVVVETTRTTYSNDLSMSSMVASMVCFAGTFWFLKDEVSVWNPAIWILCMGFIKNIYDLAACIRRHRKHRMKTSHSGRVMDGSVHDKTTSGASTESDDDDSDSASPSKPRREVLTLSPQQETQILTLADTAMDKVWELGISDDGWTSEQSTMEDVKLHSRDHKPVRIFKCETVIDLSAEELFDVLHGQFEQSSSWNVTAAENKIIKVLDETTDVVHLVTAPALGGMVTSRDFINTRKWRRQGGGFLIGSTCAGKNLLKTEKGITRGENGPTGFIILPHDSSPDKCRFIWVMNCDIKGYFPSSVIRKGTLSEMLCFVRNLRRHLAVIRGSASD